MANDIQDPKNPMAERDEPVPSTRDNLSHFKKRSEGQQTTTNSGANQQANTPQQGPGPEQTVGVYSLPPDPTMRQVRVVRVNPTNGELVSQSYDAHIVHVEQGALIIATIMGQDSWTRKILAPGTWIECELSQPTRAQQEDYIARINKFAGEQQALRESVMRAEQAAARGNPPKLGEAVDGRRNARDKKFDLN